MALDRTIRLPKDLREFIALLNSRKVEYVVVGAHALAFHGRPRYTGDLDILVRPSEDNAGKLEQVIRDFGFGPTGLVASDFLGREQVIQLGLPPNRIDLLTSISGVDFAEVWREKVGGGLDGLRVWFIGRDTLIKNKTAAGRAQDRADLEALEKG